MSESESTNRMPAKGSTALQVVQGVDMSGKCIMVTGANSGIGYETTRALTACGAHVIMACRNVVSASEAKDAILDDYPDAKLTIMHLDLYELSSVEECAAEFNCSGSRLHCLILNAGCYNPAHRVTDAGFEATFQVNHLAQFHLTKLLLPALLGSQPARVIVVASSAHLTPGISTLKPNDITWNQFSPTHKLKLNKPMRAYGLSKLANVLFAKELNRRYNAQGLTACSVNPGVIKTNIFRNSKILEAMITFMRPVSINQEQGACTSVYCATVPDLNVVGGAGAYFVDCRPKEAASAGRNAANAVKLWELSEEMLDHYSDSVAQEPQATTNYHKPHLMMKPARDTDLDPVQEDTDLDPVQEDTDLDPVQEDTDLDPVQEDTDLDPVHEDTDLDPVQEDTDLDPVQEDTDLDPVQEDED